MKNTTTFMIEGLREMMLINFICKMSGYYFDYPNKDIEVRFPDKIKVDERVHCIPDKKYVPDRTTFYFKVKNEQKPKENAKRKKSRTRMTIANVPSDIISNINIEESADEDVP